MAEVGPTEAIPRLNIARRCKYSVHTALDHTIHTEANLQKETMYIPRGGGYGPSKYTLEMHIIRMYVSKIEICIHICIYRYVHVYLNGNTLFLGKTREEGS